MMIQKRADFPPQLATIPDDKVVEVDVREELRAGQEPFSRIMAACGSVSEGGALSVRAIFEPVPLYGVLAGRGFVHHTEELGAEDWRVWFYRPADGAVAPPEPGEIRKTMEDTTHPDLAHEGGDVVVLDVRNLEPPEPMSRTLAALETLPPGSTLLHINQRVPQLLFPHLESRGYTYEIREQESDLVRVFIARGATHPDPHAA